MNAEAMTERFELRLSTSVLARLDSWRSQQEDVPTRSEAMRRLVEAGLDEKPNRHVVLGNGERLIVLMLCQLLKHLKVDGDIDPKFVEDVIYGGHFWAFDWEYQGIFHSHVDSEAVLSEVVDILGMWSFLESGFKELSQQDKDKVAAEAEPFGKRVVFNGFDGNNEGQYIGIAKFLINKLDRFTDFKGRDLNSHFPSVDMHRRMFAVFGPIRQNLIGRGLTATEIIQILRARLHPSGRTELETN